jgi:hypothetical protein
VFLSDAATGAGLTGTTASGAVASAGTGTDLLTKATKKSLDVITAATGKYVLSITDAGKTGFYPCCNAPGSGQIQVGAQLTAGSYG